MPVKEFDFRQDLATQEQMNLPQLHQFGFIAQDVQKVFPNLITKVYAPKIDHSNRQTKISGSTDFLAVNYTSFIPLLTRAVQELSTQNDSLKNALQNLQTQIDELKTMIVSNASTTSNQQSAIISSASLSQNIPNPFSNSTTINYALPKQFSSAKIIVTDKTGKVLKEINISSGKGLVNIDASTLSSGAYQYSLYVDGKRIDTKQMILTK